MAQYSVTEVLGAGRGFPTSWDASWRIIGANGTALWDGANIPIYEVVVPSKETTFLNNYKRYEATT